MRRGLAHDEAQRIKNPNAAISRAATKLKARFCIAATGTPVENNLTDLWSIFDFIQPGLLEPLNRFNRLYQRPIEARTEEERARLEELRRLIDPQILRRMKTDVARDLPEKRSDEACRRLPMSERNSLYTAALAAHRTASDGAKRTDIAQLITRLRRICTDPRSGRELDEPLPPLEEYRRISPKLDWLLETLERIRQREEKAIVFLDRRDIQRLGIPRRRTRRPTGPTGSGRSGTSRCTRRSSWATDGPPSTSGSTSCSRRSASSQRTS